MKSKPSKNAGFTLIELIVVLAGLGILSSLAIPNYLKYLDYAKVDQAKSMLNSAAADCLQSLRMEGTSRLGKITDETILSNELMESISYQFKADLKNCGSVLITTTDNTTPQRLPDLALTACPFASTDQGITNDYIRHHVSPLHCLKDLQTLL